MQMQTYYLLLVVAVATAASTASTQAASLSTFERGYADACIARATLCDVAGQLVEIDNGVASLNNTYGSAASNAVLTVNEAASAMQNSFHANVSESFDIKGTTPTAAYGRAWSEFQDVITVNFAPFTGQTGYMAVQYTLDGTLSQTGAARSLLGIVVDIGPNLEQQYQTFYSSSVSGLFRIPMTYTFTYGTPFELFFRLYAISGTFAPNSGIISTLGSGTGTTDFANTASIAGLEILDAQGNPVPGPQINSELNIAYPNTAVPEPRTIVLFGFGLIVGVVCRWRKLRQCSINVNSTE